MNENIYIENLNEYKDLVYRSLIKNYDRDNPRDGWSSPPSNGPERIGKCVPLMLKRAERKMNLYWSLQDEKYKVYNAFKDFEVFREYIHSNFNYEID